ncbi:hypothetical protein [Phenylobacterium sp.]|jgi:hypothetical protein|uniref:hypothetical protein n=1 Tax=Phenylobacterium sp. TaxID=1871053 RepID=UPI002F95F53B
MISAEESERAALDQYEPRWEAEGYRVIRHPGADVIPEFLGRFQPDAIAVGREPKLLIEVIRKGAPHAEEKVRRLKALIGDRTDWQLEVLYSGEEERGVAPADADDISRLLVTVRHLAVNEPRAALLMAWAGLEALARRLEPQRAVRPQTPGRVVELLAGAGYIAPSEAHLLRAAADVRNKLIHGDLSVHPTPADIEEVEKIAGALLTQIKGR